MTRWRRKNKPTSPALANAIREWEATHPQEALELAKLLVETRKKLKFIVWCMAILASDGYPPIPSVVMDLSTLIDGSSVRDPLQLNPPPRPSRCLVDLADQPLGASAQGDEPDPQSVEFIELGVRRQLGIKDQFFGIASRSVVPELGKTKDLVILAALAQFPIASEPSLSEIQGERSAGRSNSCSAEGRTDDLMDVT